MAISSGKVAIWKRALQRIGETADIQSEDEKRPAAEAGRIHYDDTLRALLEAHPWPWAMRQSTLAEVSEQSSTADGDGANADFVIPFAYRDLAQLTVTHISATGVETELAADTDYAVTNEVGAQPYVTTTAIPVAGASIRITVTTSRVGWSYLYPVPADCVRPVALLASGQRHALTSVGGRIPFTVMPDDGGTGQLLCCDWPAYSFDCLEYVGVIDDVASMPRLFVDALVWALAAEFSRSLRKDPKVGDYCDKRATESLAVAMAAAQNIGHEDEPLTPSLAARG